MRMAVVAMATVMAAFLARRSWSQAELAREVGVRPEAFQVVAAKGVVSPRPAYAPIAAEIVLVNTPGVTSSDLAQFAYARRRRPLYPFESDATYE